MLFTSKRMLSMPAEKLLSTNILLTILLSMLLVSANEAENSQALSASLNCPRCALEYEDDINGRCPCIGTCGHELCLSCKKKLPDPSCPFCSEPLAFKDAAFNYVLLDKLLSRQASASGKDTTRTSSICAGCNRTLTLYLCEDCGLVDEYLEKHPEPHNAESSAHARIRIGPSNPAKRAITKAKLGVRCMNCLNEDKEHRGHKLLDYCALAEEANLRQMSIETAKLWEDNILLLKKNMGEIPSLVQSENWKVLSSLDEIEARDIKKVQHSVQQALKNHGVITEEFENISNLLSCIEDQLNELDERKQPEKARDENHDPSVPSSSKRKNSGQETDDGAMSGSQALKKKLKSLPLVSSTVSSQGDAVLPRSLAQAHGQVRPPGPGMLAPFNTQGIHSTLFPTQNTSAAPFNSPFLNNAASLDTLFPSNLNMHSSSASSSSTRRAAHPDMISPPSLSNPPLDAASSSSTRRTAPPDMISPPSLSNPPLDAAYHLDNTRRSLDDAASHLDNTRRPLDDAASHLDNTRPLVNNPSQEPLPFLAPSFTHQFNSFVFTSPYHHHYNLNTNGFGTYGQSPFPSSSGSDAVFPSAFTQSNPYLSQHQQNRNVFAQDSRPSVPYDTGRSGLLNSQNQSINLNESMARERFESIPIDFRHTGSLNTVAASARDDESRIPFNPYEDLNDFLFDNLARSSDGGDSS